MKRGGITGETTRQWPAPAAICVTPVAAKFGTGVLPTKFVLPQNTSVPSVLSARLNKSPAAMAAQSTRGIGDGKRVVPRRDYAGWEFGANRMAYSRYERKNRTKPGYHTVTRRTMMHLPRRTPEGRAVYPAFAEVAPRMVSLWVQLIVKSYYDAAEGKR